MGLSEAELAERSGSSVDKVQELERLGILVRREEDGPFAAKDAHRVRLMEAFEAAGIPLELIAQGVAAGKLSYENVGLLLPEPAAFSTSCDDVARKTGRSPDTIRRLISEFGLPQTDPERLRDDDARVLVELLDVWADADDDELARLARAYGQNIRRLVASDLEIASTSLFARLRRSGLTDEEMRVAGAGPSPSSRRAAHFLEFAPPRVLARHLTVLVARAAELVRRHA